MKTVFRATAAIALIILSVNSRADWSEAIPKLTVEDLEKIGHAVSETLNDQPVGTEVPWANDETGSHGVITLNRLFQVNSAECRRIRYQITARERNNWRIDFDYCKNEEGLWERQPGLYALDSD